MPTIREPHPKTHLGDLAAPPPALTPLCLMPNWLVWRWQRTAKGWTKPPFRSDDPNRHAANNNPSTWSTRPEAVKAVLAGKANGIGFALTDTEIGAVDLDDCRDAETGAVDAWARTMISAAPNAYHEVTVSGTGLRIIGIANGAAAHKKFSISGARPSAAVEVYRRAVRYITVSGLEISRCKELPNIDALIDDIVARHDKGRDDGANGFDFDENDRKRKG
jgi:primase-polymerase (primpol)-like protein